MKEFSKELRGSRYRIGREDKRIFEEQGRLPVEQRKGKKKIRSPNRTKDQRKFFLSFAFVLESLRITKNIQKDFHIYTFPLSLLFGFVRFLEKGKRKILRLQDIKEEDHPEDKSIYFLPT